MNTTDVFNRTVYDGLVSELGAADVAEVLGGFLTDTADKLERLTKSSLDRQETRREAHSIKSSAATFGFLELSYRAKQLEAGSSQMSMEELRSAVDGLRNSFVLVLRLSDALLAVGIEEIAK